MSALVHDRGERLALVTINNPPVNALNTGVLSSL